MALALILTAVLAGVKSPRLYASENLSDDGVSVLVHPELQVLPLSRGDLQAIFTMRKRRWDEKTPVRVFVLPDNHALHRAFCKYKLGVYPYVLRDHWNRLTFSGTGYPPTVMENAEKLRDAVLTTPGAIGYIASDALLHSHPPSGPAPRPAPQPVDGDHRHE